MTGYAGSAYLDSNSHPLEIAFGDREYCDAVMQDLTVGLSNSVGPVWTVDGCAVAPSAPTDLGLL